MTDDLTFTYLEALPGEGAALQAKLVSLGAPGGHVLARNYYPEYFVVLETDGPGTNLNLQNLLASAPDRRHHKALTTSGSLSDLSDGMMVVTHVDIVPAHKNEGTALVTNHVAQSAAHTGCLFMGAYAQSDRHNHMTLLERWSDAGALSGHKRHPDTVAFRSDVLPLCGSLYDERFCSRLST